MKKKAGRVYLVGAGPGDPGLITLKGVKCLGKADVVVYDFLSDASLLSHAPESAEIVYVGKSGARHTMEQSGINRLLVDKGNEGRTVVRLKGGDPFVFGRGGEECDALREAGIPYEVVPGITSGIAAPAYAGIPVTHRGLASSMALITGNEDPHKPATSIHWEHLSKGVDTLVFYMGVGNLPGITAELMRHGRSPDTPVAVIRWGTKNVQQTVSGTLSTIVDAVSKEKIKPPAITVVGAVASLRERMRWFETRPLFSRRIINTRTRGQASALTGMLSELGAEVIELPTIAIEKVGSTSALAKEIERIEIYDWLVFTSPNGAESFFELLMKKRGDVRAIGKARIASIGPGTTAAVEKYHVRVDVTAEEAVAEGLVKALSAARSSWKDVPVLLARAEKARDVLPESLRAWGAALTVATAYRTVKPAVIDQSVVSDIATGNYDLITFSSSSTFENFVALVGEESFSRLTPALKAASIGPVTSGSIREKGIEPLVEAKEHTIPGLVNAILGYFTS